MSLEARLIALAQAIGTDIKTLSTKQGDLTALATTARGNLVAALNELHSMIGGAGATINDTAGDGDTLVTWSADKIHDAIEAAKAAVKNDLTAGAAAALDTLAELATALGNDPGFAATIAGQIAARVRFDAGQVLDAAEKAQACENIGVGNPERDFVADYAAAKA